MADTQVSNDLPKKLPAVPEAILKRRIRRTNFQAQRLKTSIKQRNAQYKKKVHHFKRAEAFVKEYRMKERDEMRIKRQAKSRGNYLSTNGDRLAFVIRLKGANEMSPKTKKILHLFKLRQVNNAVFLKLNKATINMLRIVEPYVAWGYPNLKSVRDLIYKRGFAKVDRERVPITNNSIIEEKLGKSGLICTEDLVHEIFTVGDNFAYASNFLWPFKLNVPTGGWSAKLKHFKNGGDYGNREDKVNELIRRMI